MPPCGRRLILVTGLLSSLAGQDQGVQPLTAAHSEASTPVYDPLRGLDADGRIPRVALPADLPSPERWRYIPEGRIHPGNLWQRFLVTSFAAPILYYEEDIGYGGGIALTDIDFRGQRRREFLGLFASASSEGQENYAVVWKRSLNHRNMADPPAGVLIEERSWIRIPLGYEVVRTRRFFGAGSRSHEDDETSFTNAATFLQPLVQLAVPDPGRDWVATVGARLEHHDLQGGLVSSVPSTEDVYPGLMAAGDDHDALWTIGALRYDTRDSQHNAYRGWHVGVLIEGAPWQSRGESGAVGVIEAGFTVPVPSFFHDGGIGEEENPPTDVVVVGAFVKDTAGDLPFWALPSLGGSETLRGYIGNRFTDRAAGHATVEWRTWLFPRGARFTDAIRIERLGLALFYDLGTVAPGVEDLAEARIHDSAGIGFRLAFERAAVFRVDVGFSAEGPAVTATFGMSL